MRTTLKRTALIITSLAITAGCSLDHDRDNVRLFVDIQGDASRSLQDQMGLVGIQSLSNPADIDSFGCFAVNVIGPGLESRNGYGGFGTGCTYPGITSPLIGPQGGSVSLTVPSGPKRMIQMVGVTTTNACPVGHNLQELLAL